MVKYAFFTCGWDGNIKEVIHSTFNSNILDKETPLFSFFQNDCQEKVINFFNKIKRDNFAYGWEFNIDIDKEIVQVLMTGALIKNEIIIAITEKDSSISKYYEEMLKVNNHQTTEIRNLQQKLVVFEKNLSNQFDEISKLNNELINTKRLLEQKNAKLESLNKKLEIISITDELTNLYNRRHFFDIIRKEIKRAIRMNYQITLLSIDINNFKKVNDTHGHFAGDQLLKKLATIITDNVREGLDIPFRFGGDEFTLLLSDCSKERALEIANRIDEKFKESTDIASLAYGAEELDIYNPNIENVLQEADKKMYNHKQKTKAKE
ncbi:MAG: diguanylate cyclase [Clostridia bacterium]